MKLALSSAASFFSRRHHASGSHYCGCCVYYVALPPVNPIVDPLIDIVWHGWVSFSSANICLRCWAVRCGNHFSLPFSLLPYPGAYPTHAPHRTLIDSTPGVLKAWETFAKDYALGDFKAIAHATHGRRLYDTLKEYCHIKDEAKLRVCVPGLSHSMSTLLMNSLWG